MTEYKNAGAHARDVLVLQQLVPLLTAISGSERETRIAEWTVLPEHGRRQQRWSRIRAAGHLRS